MKIGSICLYMGRKRLVGSLKKEKKKEEDEKSVSVYDLRCNHVFWFWVGGRIRCLFFVNSTQLYCNFCYTVCTLQM